MFQKIVEKFMLTCIITYSYTVTWMALELIIYKAITERLVDDIIMLLFIPIIWIASDKILEYDKKEDNHGKDFE